MKSLRANLGLIVLCLVELAVGVVLLIDPDRFTRAVLFVVGAVLLIAGIVCVIRYFISSPEMAVMEKNLAIGLLCLIAGALFVFRNSLFPSLTHIYGIALLIVGAVKFQQGIDRLRFRLPYWYLTVINALIAMVISVLILIDPFKAMEMLWRIVAIALIVEAILDLAAVITGIKAGPTPSGPPLGQVPERFTAGKSAAAADSTDFQPVSNDAATAAPPANQNPAPYTPEDMKPVDPGENK